MSNKIIISSGLALFAMFFGAGNIIYPLELGAQAGEHFAYVSAAFLIAAIGLPLLGLFAASLFQGDYWAFFRRLGTVPAFLLITFLILIIGPLFAIPRTETITFHTLEPFLHHAFKSQYLFSAIYCLAIFVLTARHSKVVDIIGYFLSPIKLVLFIILIIAGIGIPHIVATNTTTVTGAIKLGLVGGYSTMDLLATFFFSSVVCKSIAAKSRAQGITDPKTIIKIFLQSCLVGGALLGLIYSGFMLLAFCHAPELQGVQTAQMITVISNIVLGKLGALFVGICVSFACIVTAIALTDVSATFFHEHIFKKKIPHIICLIGTIIVVYIMSILGFSFIMKVALPILVVLYPALIIYCIINIGFQLYGFKKNSIAKVSTVQRDQAAS